MRFEATIEDCVVSAGRDPEGPRRRLLPRRPHLQAADGAGHPGPAQHGRHGPGPRVRGRQGPLPQPLDPHPQVPARGEARQEHVRVVRRRVERLAQLRLGRRQADPAEPGDPAGHVQHQHLPLRRRDPGLGRAGRPADRARPDHARDQGRRPLVEPAQPRDVRSGRPGERQRRRGLPRRRRSRRHLRRPPQVGLRHRRADRLRLDRREALRDDPHRQPRRQGHRAGRWTTRPTTATRTTSG